LRSAIDRDLEDATLADLSADRRFAIAYNAALLLSTMAIACAGYRIVGPRHHRTTLEAVPLAMGQEVADFARYLDICRRKRNVIDYDLASTASETEAIELLEKADEFRRHVEDRINNNHPDLAGWSFDA
jgi:uncharacterized protein (UPF0332 family)